VAVDELAVVIGQRATNVPLDQALDYVSGYRNGR
jgi:2-keto-4-pentenoate hydratase/2-oxohepta-3-ene-1,7-dioic acid hydratase in catechol pathway